MITTTEVLKEAIKNHIIGNTTMPEGIIVSHDVYDYLVDQQFNQNNPHLAIEGGKKFCFNGLYITKSQKLTNHNVKFIH